MPPAERGPSSPPLFWRLTGFSMWPALRIGDWLFGHPLREGETPAPGSILVVAAPNGGLIAHRLTEVSGASGDRRFYLAGDLSGPDAPFEQAAVRGVAETVYRADVGFLDIAPPLPLGPLGRALVSPLARVWTWAARRQSASSKRSDGPAGIVGK